MGIAAYNRGSRAISQHIAAEQRPVEFEIIESLNALEKYPDAGKPFMALRLYYFRGVWNMECPKTGFAFWYSTLHEAVRRWRVTITGYEHGVFIAEPQPTRE